MRTTGLAALVFTSLVGAALMAQGEKKVFNLGPPPIGPYSTAVRAGHFIYVAGALATGPDGKIVGATAGEQTTGLSSSRWAPWSKPRARRWRTSRP